jgi:cytoskeletal protein CcmA (bactofilin family)
MFELRGKDSQESDSAKAAEPLTRSNATQATAPPRVSGMAVIGRSIQIRGDLRGDEDIRIEGDIEGSIHLPNHALTIGREGRVRADAYAKSVIIDGETQGDVYGAECVTIRASAQVTGNILASRVSFEEGARFKGSIDMDPQSVTQALETVSKQATTTHLPRASAKPRNVVDDPVRTGPEQAPNGPKANDSVTSA